MAVNKSNQKTMEANHRGLSFLVTLLFAVLCFFIAFPLLAGLLASFRPGRELVQNGLAINVVQLIATGTFKRDES